MPFLLQKQKKRASPKAAPESKRIKCALNKRLDELKPRRNKKSLASQRLLFKTVQLIWNGPKQVSAWRERKRKKMPCRGDDT